MAGNCTNPCYGCNCSCEQAGNHPNCSGCMNCKASDNHTRKES